jgi:hypothetical protein
MVQGLDNGGSIGIDNMLLLLCWDLLYKCVFVYYLHTILEFFSFV